MPDSTSETYVWVWLPGCDKPVPAGLLEGRDRLRFRYGAAYLTRPDAVSLGPDLPLDDRWHSAPVPDLALPGTLRDAAPDAWGRRVVAARLGTTQELPEVTYLLESGTDRFGALDFQTSPAFYKPRDEPASLADLLTAADLVAAGDRLPPALTAAILRGTSLGGARPKAVLTGTDGRQWLAKFSTSDDPYPVVNAEAACLVLARQAGVEVPDSQVVRTMGRDVLLVERFDRGLGGTRRLCLSGLTLLGLGEMTARYGTYPDLLDALIAHGAPAATRKELFTRIAVNMAVTNTDDHLRNHAVFWDGAKVRLTPAYDICPSPRSGDTAFQALAYGRNGERKTNLLSLVECAEVYGLSRPQARAVVDQVTTVIREGWEEAADQAKLPAIWTKRFYGAQILHPSLWYSAV